MFITGIRGGTGDYYQLADKNAEEYYGCSDENGIVFVLGGDKDVSFNAVKMAAAHEFVHTMLAGGYHHELPIPGRNDTPYFDADAPCLFYGNSHREKRVAEPCAFLDFQLRLATQGFKDRQARRAE